MKREGQRIFTVAVDVSAGVEEYASILPPASLARVADGQGDTAGRDGHLKPDQITKAKKERNRSRKRLLSFYVSKRRRERQRQKANGTENRTGRLTVQLSQPHPRAHRSAT